MSFSTIIGAIGLVLVSIGVLNKNEKREDTLFIIGGIFLLMYSIAIGNVIFIILQAIFILSAAYELFWKKRS